MINKYMFIQRIINNILTRRTTMRDRLQSSTPTELPSNIHRSEDTINSVMSYQHHKEESRFICYKETDHSTCLTSLVTTNRQTKRYKIVTPSCGIHHQNVQQLLRPKECTNSTASETVQSPSLHCYVYCNKCRKGSREKNGEKHTLKFKKEQTSNMSNFSPHCNI